MGLHDYPKQCCLKYLQSLQKQVNTEPIRFPQHSRKQCCKQVLKFYGRKATEIIRWAETDPNTPEGAIDTAQLCRAIATTSKVGSQLSNLHWPGVGISNKNKIILAQNITDVKLPRVYLALFRVNLCLI